MNKEVIECVKQSIAELKAEAELTDKEILNLQAEKAKIDEDIFALEHFVKRHEVVEEVVEPVAETPQNITTVVVG